MFPFRRRRARIIKKSKADKIVKAEPVEVNFASHISKYIGKTVTVFINAGGPSGCGFTGVLSYVDNTCLILIISIGPPHDFYVPRADKIFNHIGSVVYILISSVTAFVHNLT